MIIIVIMLDDVITTDDNADGDDKATSCNHWTIWKITINSKQIKRPWKQKKDEKSQNMKLLKL